MKGDVKYERFKDLIKDMLDCDEAWVEGLAVCFSENGKATTEMLCKILLEYERCPHCGLKLSSYRLMEPHGEILTHFCCPTCGEI